MSIDILQGNHSRYWIVRGCISTCSAINMWIIERKYMYIRKNHAHVYEENICCELLSDWFSLRICACICVCICVLLWDHGWHVSEVGSLLLAQDAVILLVSHWQGEPQIEGQTVITTCRDSHPVPFSHLRNFHKEQLKMLGNHWMGLTTKAYVLSAIRMKLPVPAERHIPPTKENVKFTSLLWFVF